MNTSQIIPIETIGQKILIIRGVKVMLDSDLAELYGITTGNLNLAVRRNLERFPEDFMFQLAKEEHNNLKSQFVTSSSPNNPLHIARGYQKHRSSRFLPYAFTEHGVAMLSSVLRSSRAVQMNIFIIRAFIKIRELLATNKELAYKVEELEKNQEKQGEHIQVIHDLLKRLMAEPIKPQKNIGFARP